MEVTQQESMPLHQSESQPDVVGTASVDTKGQFIAEEPEDQRNGALGSVLDRIEQLQKQLSLLQNEVGQLRPAPSSSTNPNASQFFNSIWLLLHDTNEETHAGSSAIITKVNTIKNSIVSKIYKEVQGMNTMNRPPLIHDELMKRLDDRTGTAIPVVPDVELERMFLRYYHKLMSQRYFFYEPEDLERLADIYFSKSDRECPKFIDKLHRDTILNLILATGCRLVMMSTQMTYLNPGLYFDKAMDCLSKITYCLKTLDQIRVIMYIALYLLVSYDHNIKFTMNIWELSGLAIRKMTQMGLQRFIIPSVKTAKDYETKKRIFWSVYSFEKVICVTLGRPASIPDDEIDVPYSLNIDSMDTISDEDLYKLQIEQQRLQYEKHDHRIIYPAKISFSYYLTQMCRIREIESHIGRLEQIISIPIAPAMLTRAVEIDPKYNEEYSKIMAELEKWKRELPPEHEFIEGLHNQIPFEYLTLCYHRAKLFLCLTRLMKKGDQSVKQFHSLLIEISEAAGGVCRAYIVLAKDPAFGYGMFSLHSIFLAGILLAYSIVHLDSDGTAHSDKTRTFHNYLRHCSVLLSLFAERTKKAASFRILFDRLLEDGVFSKRLTLDSDAPSTPASFYSQSLEPDMLGLHNLMEIFNSNRDMYTFEEKSVIDDDDDFWEKLDAIQRV
ncbi:hypothetical protein OGAPHI_000548 [Ogataea philodendri]|uniref:Xylanolytic transcriptional activator regulatory domain-containing protein n=1 Tax=Ogataea philodendri TaxID=1378263 RepID=A0A9P8PGR7_9ASCO|nr:uncharacterized protein OGAPHI_000548 [Ogataea philodendri]KAH3671325.1 hypothetical protein OGAPHI_000548 [Ogataea philodendri]